jgi:hypothetical protein
MKNIHSWANFRVYHAFRWLYAEQVAGFYIGGAADYLSACGLSNE